MARLLQITLIAILFAIAALSHASEEILVIVNKDNQITELSQRELIDLYMGRSQQFPNGRYVIRIDQLPDSKIREAFYRSLVDKSVTQVNAYWARLLFTGRASPPVVVTDDKLVIKTVSENRNTIGYITADQLDNSVKVIMRVE